MVFIKKNGTVFLLLLFSTTWQHNDWLIRQKSFLLDFVAPSVCDSSCETSLTLSHHQDKNLFYGLPQVSATVLVNEQVCLTESLKIILLDFVVQVEVQSMDIFSAPSRHSSEHHLYRYGPGIPISSTQRQKTKQWNKQDCWVKHKTE